MITILGEDLGYDKSQAMRMATPFGGGIARWGAVCGAVVGGTMALGFRYGRTRAEEKEEREKTYAKVQEMLGKFEKEYGTVQCRGLINLNLMDPADRKKFDELGLRKRCAGFVSRIAENVRKTLKEK